jgi:hypothetical protein
MAPSIVVGTNSYVTEAESNTILEEFVLPAAQAWPFSIVKVPSLITAFYDISSFTLIDPTTGLEVDPNAAPTPVKQAQALLAAEYSSNPKTAAARGQGGSNIKSVGAGSAKVSFFRPEDKTRFPSIVGRLLAPYLTASSSSVFGSFASGTDGVSSFENEGGQLTEGYK